MNMVEKACRNCHLIFEQNVCPDCKSTETSDDFRGLVIIIDPDDSVIAKVMQKKNKGRYAVRIR